MKDHDFLAEVQQNGLALQYASEELRGNKEVVLAAVQQDVDSLQYADKKLLEDRSKVLALVSQNGRALQWASKELQEDREIVLAADLARVKEHPVYLQFAIPELKADREVVLEAVGRNGLVLEFASEELRASRELVLAAVKQNGIYLQFASEELQADRELVLVAVMKNSKALEFASEELQDDPELIFKVFEDKSSALRTMEITRIASIVSTLKLKNLSSRQNIINTLNNKDKFVEWVSRYGKILKYASRELKADREVVLAAVKQDGDALQFASRELQNDPEIKLKALLSQYRKAENDQEKQRFRADIINLVVGKLNSREDGKPINLTTYINFKEFLEIRRDPEIILAIIRNYSQKEDRNSALGMTIFGVGGNHSAAEVFQQIEEKDLLGKLNADESVKWQNFKDNYKKQPSPSVASSSADGARKEQPRRA